MIYATLNQDYDPYPDFSTIDCRFTAREQGSTDRLFLVPSEMLFFCIGPENLVIGPTSFCP